MLEPKVPSNALLPPHHQVRPSGDAVRCVLGDELLGHAGVHPLCFLCMHLPPCPHHPPLLSTDSSRLRSAVEQLCVSRLREAHDFLVFSHGSKKVCARKFLQVAYPPSYLASTLLLYIASFFTLHFLDFMEDLPLP